MIISTDILIKTALEAGIADLRKNSWILDDVFGGLASDDLSRVDYGYKEVDQAKKWFLSTDIPVILPYRTDDPVFPCITVVHASMIEAKDRSTLGDKGIETEIDPQTAGIKQAFKVYNNFTPKKYDINTGEVTMPDGLTTSMLSTSMYLVSQRSGKAYQIRRIMGSQSFRISPSISDDFGSTYVVPPTLLWNVENEVIFTNDVVQIGVHAQSDIAQSNWLHQLTWYVLLRCREAYLEARGFEISSIQSDAMQPNSRYEAEKIYSRYLTLTGTQMISFIKFAAPKLYVINQGIKIIDGPKTPDQYTDQVNKQGWKMENDPDPAEEAVPCDRDILLGDITVIGEDEDGE